MNLKNIFIIICSVAFPYGAALGQQLVKASDFGVKANSFENASFAIRKAIAACKGKDNVVLLLPPGRIDIWPDGAEERELYISNSTESDSLPKVKKIAFAFDNCNNLTLDGNNSLVVLHGKMVSFALLNSSNITIKNIQFDYERPTMSELTINSVTDTVVEADIHPDSKYFIDNSRIGFYGEGWRNKSYHTILFNPQQDRLYYSNLKPLLESKAIELNPFHVRFEGKFGKVPYRVGDRLSTRDPYRDNCGGFISRSKNIALENVQMHFMHGLGIVSQFSENISLLKVSVAPRKNSNRIIASFADCFHFSGCKGLVKIDSCFTSGSHDDPVNVHGTHLQISSVNNSNNKLMVRFMHHQTYGFEAFFAGDSIAFVHPQTLMPLGKAKLKAAKLVNKKEMEIEVEGNLPAYAAIGLCIENLSWTPEVIIRNSRFERTNTRGLLITTRRKVLIENNTFYHTGMFPILIADDASSWFESGSVQDVTIRNNVFEDCGYNSGGAINIAPENHELIIGNMVHRNIRIIGNSFKLINNTVLSARSVDNLLFANNTITFSNPSSKQKKIMVNLTACKNVKIQKNLAKQANGLEVNAIKMRKSDLKADCKVNLKE